MNDHQQQEQAPDIVVRIRRDLRAIEKLYAEASTLTEHPLGVPEPRPAGFIGPMPEAVRRVRVTGSRLLTEAVAAGADPDMPGGAAMVAMANVGNAEAWAERLDTAEELAQARSWRTGQPTVPVEVYDDDDAWQPPLQTLLAWSEPWRELLNMERDPVRLTDGRYVDRRPTVASEASFLRWVLDWVWADEIARRQLPRLEDDIQKARKRAEDLLHDGVRSERGVPCLYEECKGKRLVRKLVPTRDEDGNKVWVWSPWHCPRCHREWTPDAYARMVTAASEAAKIEQIQVLLGDPEIPETIVEEPGDSWCSVDYAAHRTGRPAATIRVWAHRGRVATVCLLAGRRSGYIRVADLDEQHALAERRAAAARRGRRRHANHTVAEKGANQ
jgi:hypothetical protein